MLFYRDVICLLYTSDAADERSSVDLGGRRIIKKKKKQQNRRRRKPSQNMTNKSQLQQSNKIKVMRD